MSRYVMREGAVRELGPLVEPLGQRCLLLVDRHATPELLREVADGLYAGGRVKSVETMQLTQASCAKESARALAADVARVDAEVVVALGGSKVLDLARASMRPLQPNRPALVLVPLIVSSNACVGSLAVMYDGKGRVSGFWGLERAPELVVVDLELVAQGSPRFLAAAMGDQLASSLEALHAGAVRTRVESLDSEDVAGISAHQDAVSTLVADGLVALDSVSKHLVTPELERVVRAVTHYTTAQERTALVYVAHALGEALATCREVRGKMHGEIVAACVPAELVAAGEREEVPRWARFLRETRLPASLSELGLEGLSESRAQRLCRDALTGMLGQDSMCPLSAEELACAVCEAERLVG